jgi:hypothetical protein
MAQLASGKKCQKIAPVCPKLGMMSEVWDKYGTLLNRSIQQDVTEVGPKNVRAGSNIAGKFFSKFKGTTSRQEHQTSFKVLTTIERNLLIELTKSCK